MSLKRHKLKISTICLNIKYFSRLQWSEPLMLMYDTFLRDLYLSPFYTRDV